MTDSQLLASGDRAALEEFYNRYSSMVYRYSRQMSQSEDLAAEVTQQVFLAVIQHGKRFDASRGAVTAWLFGIARNQLKTIWYRDSRTEVLETDVTAEEFDFDQAISAQRLRGAIDQLGPMFREVIVLCELEELKYEEVAGILEVPVGTVRSRLHRAKAQLAKTLTAKEVVRHEV